VGTLKFFHRHHFTTTRVFREQKVRFKIFKKIHKMTQKTVKPFGIVEFDENGKKLVSVISKSWLSNSNSVCAWPSGPNSHQKLINHIPPEPNWQRYPCRLLKFSGKF